MRRTRLAIAAAGVLATVVSLHGQAQPSELADAAWKAMRSDNPKRAASLFNEALTLAPDDPLLLLGAGSAAHALGQQPVAMARLERALELRPQLTPASVLLAHIAFDEGHTDAAIRTLEAARAFAPDDKALASLIARWRGEADAHATFSDRRFERFRVLFEGHAEQSLATQATTVFDSAFFRIGSVLGEYPADTIVAVLYTERQFRDITRAPAWSGGQYDGRIRVPVSGAEQHPEEFERVLVHELTHAIVANIAGRRVPAWLNEGIAQHFDGTDADAARRRLVGSGRTMPLRSLERGFQQLDAADARVAYDESLVATELLFDRPGFGWIRLLHRLRDGGAFADAIGFFGFSYDDLEHAWRR
ncbi:MAG TPA: tetratricopeptide repeat protein [Vicinamibacterales bacterium]|nr:tetratricopeptide repeat protein [Vicinamibacterales bacterium]